MEKLGGYEALHKASAAIRGRWTEERAGRSSYLPNVYKNDSLSHRVAHPDLVS